MELRQLRSFLALAEELHFGRAAQRLHITQPALSMQIAGLEEQLGTSLFDRSSRRIELTDAGRFLVGEARALTQQVERIERTTRLAGATTPSGVLRLGYTPSVELQLLPLMLRACRERFPAIEFCLHTMPSPRQLIALQNDMIDLALVRLPIDLPANILSLTPVGKEPLVLAIPADHRLATRRTVNLANLREEPVILFRREVAPDSHDRITAACREAGMNLRIAYEVEGLQAGLSLVCAGLGIAFVPASARTIPRHGVAFVPLRQPAIELELGLVSRIAKHHDAALEGVRDIIIETARSVYP
ncbi:LysR family transcriptional regulator [bacterium]|nr:LysR family transcriptional regulator [bacterium]